MRPVQVATSFGLQSEVTSMESIAIIAMPPIGLIAMGC